MMIGTGRYFAVPADLIAVDARKHQIKENQVGLKFGKYRGELLPRLRQFSFQNILSSGKVEISSAML